VLRRQRVRLDRRRAPVVRAPRRLNGGRRQLHRCRRPVRGVGARRKGRRVGDDHRALAGRHGRRDDLVIATKVGQAPGREGLSPANIAAAADASLARLGTDPIDLYYAHEDDPGTPLEETMAAFPALVTVTLHEPLLPLVAWLPECLLSGHRRLTGSPQPGSGTCRRRCRLWPGVRGGCPTRPAGRRGRRRPGWRRERWRTGGTRSR